MKFSWNIHINKEDVLRKTLNVAALILVYGAYGYVSRECGVKIEYGKPDVEGSSLYGRAVNAISNSGMSSYYKTVALQGLRRDESEAYYEAVISIANGSMSSYYKAESIYNLGGRNG